MMTTPKQPWTPMMRSPKGVTLEKVGPLTRQLTFPTEAMMLEAIKEAMTAKTLTTRELSP